MQQIFLVLATSARHSACGSLRAAWAPHPQFTTYCYYYCSHQRQFSDASLPWPVVSSRESTLPRELPHREAAEFPRRRRSSAMSASRTIREPQKPSSDPPAQPQAERQSVLAHVACPCLGTIRPRELTSRLALLCACLPFSLLLSLFVCLSRVTTT